MKSRGPLRGAGDEVFKSHTILFVLFHTQQQQQVGTSPSHVGGKGSRRVRVSGSTPCTIAGYAALIKAPFQPSTHPDLSQCKHSLSQLSPKPLHWDVNRHFYGGVKEKCMHIMAHSVYSKCKRCVAASPQKQGLMDLIICKSGCYQQLWQ